MKMYDEKPPLNYILITNLLMVYRALSKLSTWNSFQICCTILKTFKFYKFLIHSTYTHRGELFAILLCLSSVNPSRFYIVIFLPRNRDNENFVLYKIYAFLPMGNCISFYILNWFSRFIRWYPHSNMKTFMILCISIPRLLFYINS